MTDTYTLPLFPLNIVAFPQGVLPLKIFETRYLDMVRSCLRNNMPFGIAAVNAQDSLDEKDNLPFARVGTSVAILEADATSPNIMLIRCNGQHRFCIKSAEQQKDGLWLGQVNNIPNDLPLAIPEELRMTMVSLQHVIDSITDGLPDNEIQFIKPFRFNDCSWVANRWCELLDLTLVEKQQLLELESPVLRLKLVQDKLLSDFPGWF